MIKWLCIRQGFFLEHIVWRNDVITKFLYFKLNFILAIVFCQKARNVEFLFNIWKNEKLITKYNDFMNVMIMKYIYDVLVT